MCRYTIIKKGGAGVGGCATANPTSSSRAIQRVVVGEQGKNEREDNDDNYIKRATTTDDGGFTKNGWWWLSWGWREGRERCSKIAARRARRGREEESGAGP